MKNSLRLFLLVHFLNIAVFLPAAKAELNVIAPDVMGSQILKHYLILHPAKNWSFDWETAIFLFGAIRFCEKYSLVNDQCAFVDQYFAGLKKEGIPEITMPDLVAMSLPAVAWAPYAKKDAKEQIQIIIEKARYYFKTEPLNKSGTFDHVGRRHSFANWLPSTSWFVPSSVWIDSSVMYILNGFNLARLMHDEQLEDFSVGQLKLFHNILLDKKVGLYKHAYFIAGDFYSPMKSFWARGNGWMALALVDMIEKLSPSHPDYEAFKAALINLLENLKKRVDPSFGLRVLLTTHPPANSFESSASALYAYALNKSLRLKLVPEEDAAFATQLRSSVLNNYLKPLRGGEISVVGISGPTMPIPLDWYYTLLISTKADKSYGVGAFLLLLSEPSRGL